MSTQNLQEPNATMASTEIHRATANGRVFSVKGFTSLLITLSFFVLAFTGIMLYFTPRGRVANWTNWTLLGLGKEQWVSIHLTNSLLFVLVAVLHLTLNWTMFWGYLRKKAVAGVNMRKELALAVAIALAVVVGTLCSVPPFSTLMAWNMQIKDYWESTAARAPVAHSEELTLVEFARQIDLSADSVVEALTKEGFEVKDARVTVGQLAEQKGLAPSAVLAAIRKHYPAAGGMEGQGPGAGRGGHGPGMGMGRGMGMGPGWGWEQEGHEAAVATPDAQGAQSVPRDAVNEAAPEGHGAGRGFWSGQGGKREK